MHLYSADPNLAYCRYWIARVSFAEGMARLSISSKQGPVHLGVQRCPWGGQGNEVQKAVQAENKEDPTYQISGLGKRFS
jgi:hypothetical protein